MGCPLENRCDGASRSQNLQDVVELVKVFKLVPLAVSGLRCRKS